MHAGHSHDEPKHFGTAFAIGVGLNLAFVIVEFMFGLSARSLALIADAGHNLTDVVGLVLAWTAAFLSTVGPRPGRSYGYRRSSILAALANAILLLIAVGAIAWESLKRLLHPEPVAGWTVILVSLIAIFVNGVTAALFFSGRRDLNLRGAFLHMAADAATAAGVVIAGVLILSTHAYWIDPLVSLIIVAVIVIGTWGLLQESLNLSLDSVPPGIQETEVKSFLAKLPRVHEVHDLHIWAISTTETALTAHLVVPVYEGYTPRDDDALLNRACHDLYHDFQIHHATLQIERGLLDCSLAPETVV